MRLEDGIPLFVKKISCVNVAWWISTGWVDLCGKISICQQKRFLGRSKEMLEMLVQSLFEVKTVVWFRIDKKQEEFDCIRFGWIISMRDASIARFFLGSAPLVPCTTLSIT